MDLNELQTKFQNMDKEELKNELLFRFAQIKPFLLNIKTLVGFVAIGFAIYTAFDELPKKLEGFNQTKTQGAQLVAQKQNLQSEEAKLKAISKELQKLDVKPLKIKEGQSPQLAAIGVAQKVVELSDSFQNTYVGLTPSPENVVLNVDSYVSLPIAAAGGAAAPTPAAPAPGTPPVPGGAPVAAGPGTFNAYKYTLTIKGSYVNLVNFMHELVQQKFFIIISNIQLKPVGIDPKHADQGPQIELVLNFLVPWN